MSPHTCPCGSTGHVRWTTEGWRCVSLCSAQEAPTPTHWEQGLLDIIQGRTPTPPPSSKMIGIATARAPALWDVVGRDEVSSD